MSEDVTTHNLPESKPEEVQNPPPVIHEDCTVHNVDPQQVILPVPAAPEAQHEAQREQDLPEINLVVESEDIVAKTRKLEAAWSFEAQPVPEQPVEVKPEVLPEPRKLLRKWHDMVDRKFFSIIP